MAQVERPIKRCVGVGEPSATAWQSDALCVGQDIPEARDLEGDFGFYLIMDGNHKPSPGKITTQASTSNSKAKKGRAAR